MRPRLVVGSPLARATYEVLRGERTVYLDYEPGIDRIAQIATVLGHLIASQPSRAHLGYPVASRRVAMSLSNDLTCTLLDVGCKYTTAKTWDNETVSLVSEYDRWKTGGHIFDQPFVLDFRPRDGVGDPLRAGDLIILDAARAPYMLAMSGSIRTRQVLVVGSRGNPRPRLGRRRGLAAGVPWGEVPTDVLLAGAPA